MKKFLLINNIPTPYREFMFRRMGEIGAEHGVELTVAYQARKEARRNWDPTRFEMAYKHFFSETSAGEPREHFTYKTFNRDIVRAVRSGAYDYVMYAPLMSITGWAISLTAPKRLTRVMWSESNLLSTAHMGGLAKLVKRVLLSNFDKLALPGENALRYLCAIDPKLADLPRLYLPNVVDTSLFVRRVHELRRQRETLRRDLGVDPAARLIFGIGQMVERKGFHRLLEALPEVDGPSHVVLLGDGPMLDQMRDRCDALGIADRVSLPGFKAEQDTLAYYAAADWFIHTATSDPSPLVSIESVSAGLPVAISQQTGNAPEAVAQGVNGYTFDVKDRADLVAVLRKMVDTTPERLAAMGAESTRIAAERFDPDAVLHRFFKEMLA